MDAASEVSGRPGAGGALAQKVLRGATRGYRHLPQLRRFSGLANPPAALAAYLTVVRAEAVRRGYKFDASKIGGRQFRGRMTETRGQLLYEWRHLKRKLKKRDSKRLRDLAPVKIPAPHPLFRIIPGRERDGEKCAQARFGKHSPTPRPRPWTS